MLRCRLRGEPAHPSVAMAQAAPGQRGDGPGRLLRLGSTQRRGLGKFGLVWVGFVGGLGMFSGLGWVSGWFGFG